MSKQMNRDVDQLIARHYGSGVFQRLCRLLMLLCAFVSILFLFWKASHMVVR